MQKVILTGFLLILWLVGPAYAQEEEINVAGLVLLKYQNNLPDNMLSTKTVVLISTPNKPGESIPEDFKPLAEEAHPVLAKAGIDAVGYYFYDDVYSGPEVRAAFARSWQQREIKNLLLIVKSELNKKGNMVYLLLATPFNGQSSLMTEGQTAWKTTSKSLKKALEKLARAANKQTSNNLLIAEVPEYFNDVPLIKGQRVESYYTDLKLGKLAVPKFASGQLPGKRPGGLVNTAVSNWRHQAAEQSVRFNAELEQIMGEYPFQYGLVEPESSEEELLKAGYTYVLYNIHTAGISVRRLLNYPVDEEEEYYITPKVVKGKPTMRYIPIKAPVYKYYIKNLKTGNVYLGKQWDADETWQEALRNTIANIKRELKQK
ncbi:MAG TPA: hypothetical protein ENJ39_04390 [Flammeovirgaceae bacterium]|nr:hypothetical protein [Flammeovirgaceae bacterium]